MLCGGGHLGKDEIEGPLMSPKEKLKTQLEAQKKELEAAAAASLEKAEEAFTKQLAEMQTLLADYQTQVGVCCCP